MSADQNKERFLKQIFSDAYDFAHQENQGEQRLPAIAKTIFDMLEEAGFFSEAQFAYHIDEGSNYAAEVHGYMCDFEDDVLSIFFFIDATKNVPLGDLASITAVGKDEVEKAFKRLETFVKRVIEKKIVGIEESQPAAELVELLQECAKTKQKIQLHVVTTGVVTDRTAASQKKTDMDRDLWDLVRLSQVCTGGGNDSIAINFTKDHDGPLPCIVSEKASDGIQVLLTSIPANVLAAIYDKYRSRLLERNVRSFLQFNGKVNKGIRQTLINEPQRFLAYNNGLSATASKVNFKLIDGKIGEIISVEEFQIVNGGQTTASIATCLRKDQVDLSLAVVPMKLSIVPAELIETLVPQISQYANTQNRIQEADFHANNPWHVALQLISRATWTTPMPGSARGSRWFYERSRGQYADEGATTGTAAGKRKFRTENPPSQKFTKTDLAKFMLSWQQEPSIVSKGAQKSFVEFMSRLRKESRPEPKLAEFQQIIGQAILFKTAERLYGELAFVGYRANVVAYAIALLSHRTQRRLPWDEIWKTQAIPDNYCTILKKIIIGVRDIIVNPPAAYTNVGEWCKRPKCWDAVLASTISIDLPGMANGQAVASAAIAEPTEEISPLINAIVAIPSEVWFAVAVWAKETNSLAPWQRSLSFSIGNLNRHPSIRQATQGKILLEKAVGLGFTHASLIEGMLTNLANSAE